MASGTSENHTRYYMALNGTHFGIVATADKYIAEKRIGNERFGGTSNYALVKV